jgi:hypothetical protein|tara:strand:- start:9390 stop:10124 length:735 start_codon:yes stop_codon:yes gene_type:complete
MNNFSFQEYKKIIKYYQKFLKPVFFSQIKKKTDNFFTIRHDVEFSIDRALQLAEIEKKDLKVRSSFFFQLRNNSYNLLSYENKKIISTIKKMGHKVGLHFNYKGKNNKKSLIKELLSQSKIFNQEFNNQYKFFSPHRPSKSPFMFKIHLKNLTNTYAELFFNDFDTAKKDKKKIIYLVDSRHEWKFLHPLKLDLLEHRKVHLVFHPDAWSKKGLSKINNYNLLRQEKLLEFNNTLLTETDYLNK